MTAKAIRSPMGGRSGWPGDSPIRCGGPLGTRPSVRVLAQALEHVRGFRHAEPGGLAVVLCYFGLVLGDPSSDVVERSHVEGRVRIVLVGSLAEPEERLFKLLLMNGDLGELDLRLDAAVLGRPAEPRLSRSGIGFGPLALGIHQTEVIRCGRIALLS